MNFLRIPLLLLLCTRIYAQEPSVYEQHFKGVQSAKFYYTETTSSGIIALKKQLQAEYFFDSLGNTTRIRQYSDGVHHMSQDYIYDSLGRISVCVEWKKDIGNTKMVYEYLPDSTGRFTKTIVRDKNGIIRIESSRWDSIRNRKIVSTWNKGDTNGAPDDHKEYNRFGQLVFDNSYNGFTEYRYDSLGTMNYMLNRQFEDGHCSAYTPFDFACEYEGGNLVHYTSKWSLTEFSYNANGHMIRQTVHSLSSRIITIYEAEYTYY